MSTTTNPTEAQNSNYPVYLNAADEKTKSAITNNDFGLRLHFKDVVKTAAKFVKDGLLEGTSCGEACEVHEGKGTYLHVSVNLQDLKTLIDAWRDSLPLSLQAAQAKLAWAAGQVDFFTERNPGVDAEAAKAILGEAGTLLFSTQLNGETDYREVARKADAAVEAIVAAVIDKLTNEIADCLESEKLAKVDTAEFRERVKTAVLAGGSDGIRQLVALKGSVQTLADPKAALENWSSRRREERGRRFQGNPSARPPVNRS